jgi:transcriptional regulator with XRE-family HTH domain
MPAHIPHRQLKRIRAQLHITQEGAAAVLGVSASYFLSVETGQRELSHPLARKVAKTFGVAQIEDKNAEPFICDSEGNLVPFTKETYLAYCSKRPSFFIEESKRKRVVTPTPADYARCTCALLEAAEDQGTLRPVILDFFDWFAQSISSDAVFTSLQRRFDQRFPKKRKNSAAFLALTMNWARRAEDQVVRRQVRTEARSKGNKARKRKR